MSLSLMASTTLAADGIIRCLFPPANDGIQHGAGQIEEMVDGVLQGKPYFNFQTPQDVDPTSEILSEDALVTFDAVDNGNRAINVRRKCPPDCPSGGGGT